MGGILEVMPSKSYFKKTRTE
jgi:hypothetical protein